MVTTFGVFFGTSSLRMDSTAVFPRRSSRSTAFRGSSSAISRSRTITIPVLRRHYPGRHQGLHFSYRTSTHIRINTRTPITPIVLSAHALRRIPPQIIPKFSSLELKPLLPSRPPLQPHPHHQNLPRSRLPRQPHPPRRHQNPPRLLRHDLSLPHLTITYF